MKNYSFLLTFLVFVFVDAKLEDVFDWQPQQIHIGYGGLYFSSIAILVDELIYQFS